MHDLRQRRAAALLDHGGAIAQDLGAVWIDFHDHRIVGRCRHRRLSRGNQRARKGKNYSYIFYVFIHDYAPFKVKRQIRLINDKWRLIGVF